MVGRRAKYSLLFLMLTWIVPAEAQHLWSEVRMDKRKVYVGEPVEVSVAVYTSTWFTKGVDPGNVKVDGAYSLYFRGISQSKQVNGKTYAGVMMIFNVFPYEAKDIVFPSLDIRVETPEEGGYKGVSKIVKTKAVKITVKPVPKGFDKTTWLVASHVEVTDKWSGSLKNIKVGDVIGRRITRLVNGTVVAFVPPVYWDTVSGVGLYPERPVTESIKTKTSIRARRTDAVRYLFEKEGRVVLPPVVVQWWDPARKRMYKRTLKAVTLRVRPNPDLGMLVSVRDSLERLKAQAVKGENEKGNNFFQKLTKKQKAALVLLFIILVCLFSQLPRFIRFIKRRAAGYRNKREAWLQSEKYHFRQFLKTAKTKGNAATLNAAYRWLGTLNLPEPALRYFAGRYGNETVIREAALLATGTAKNETKVRITAGQWILARKNYFRTKQTGAWFGDGIWINPLNDGPPGNRE